MNTSNNTKNEVSNSSLCENDDSQNQEQNSLSNVELSFIGSGWKFIIDVNLLESQLFQVHSAMQHVETKTLECAIEDFFDIMIFRLIGKGWNIAIMHYLLVNLPVACWFKLQRCMF